MVDFVGTQVDPDMQIEGWMMDDKEEEERKILQAVLITHQTTLQDDTEAHTVTGQWWAGQYLDQNRFGVYIFDPLFKHQFHSGMPSRT